MDDYRYPFPPYPTGWYMIAESADVEPGQTLPLRYFGRDIVLYRTEAGVPVVVDAHCPHMGAHLGYGGTVEGEGIRCPFHSWRFDADGSVADVPYSDTKPRNAALNCWPVQETSGLVLVHHSDHGHAPAWTMIDQPFWGQPGWVGYERARWNVRVHVQEVAENIPDTTHFKYVHGVPTVPSAHIETDGHVFRQVMSNQVRDKILPVITQVAYGLGLSWLELEAPVRYRMLVASTPIDQFNTDLRLLFLIDEGEGATEVSARGRAAVALITEQTARDVLIWEHKVYRDRPPLVAGDGPIGVMRKWAKQFYES